MLLRITPLAAVITLLAANVAHAGAIPQQGYYRTSQSIKINSALPVLCDGNITAAANTVNAMGVKFKLLGAAQNYTTIYYSASQDPGFVNVQPGSGMTSIMSTTKLFSVPQGASPPYETNDSTITVNADRIYYDTGDTVKSTDLICGTTITTANIGTRLDFQSAIVHEFGHVMGMDHRTDGTNGTCVMFTYQSAGQIRRAFCADEKAFMLGFYGAG